MNRSWRETFLPAFIILNEYWTKSKLLLVVVAITVFTSSLCSVAAPYIFSRLIDELNTRTPDTLIFYGFAAYGVLLGISTVLSRVSASLSGISSETLRHIASNSFFNRMLKKPAYFYTDYNASEIGSAQIMGSNSLFVVIRLSLINMVPGVTNIVAAFIVLGALINLEMMTIALVYGVLFIVLTYTMNRWEMPFHADGVKGLQENSRLSGNAYSAMDTLRIFGASEWMKREFNRTSLLVRDGFLSYFRRKIGFSVLFGLAMAVQFAITFWFLLPRYHSGQLSIGDVLLINMLLIQLNRPFQMIGEAIDSIAQACSRFHPFATMWNYEEEDDVADREPLAVKNGEIRFADISYKYQNGRGVENIDFVVCRGAVNYITGKTGMGKSTLLKLLLKTLEPSSGEISIDGQSLKHIHRSVWYGSIGVVSQEVMLLNKSLKENILLGRELEEDRLRECAKKADILKRIESAEEGFDTIVGERGLKLSAGERQRIAIARALYEVPAT